MLNISRMPEGYCFKCKAKREIVDGKPKTADNGAVILHGTCKSCGGKVVRILSGAKAGMKRGKSKKATKAKK